MNCLIAAKALREDNSKEQILHFNWRKNYVSGIKKLLGKHTKKKKKHWLSSGITCLKNNHPPPTLLSKTSNFKFFTNL